MSEKIVNWFTRNYGGFLNEDYQPTGMKFSFYTEKDNKLTQCHEWVKCKDYLHDVIRTSLTGEDTKIYGFQFSKENNPCIDLTKTRMLVSWAGFKDANLVEPSLINGVKLLNHLEKIANVKLSKFEKVMGDKENSFYHVWAIESPKFWMTHPHLISLYSFLLRLGDKKLEFTDEKSFDEGINELFIKYKNQPEKDVDYLIEIYENMHNSITKKEILSNVNKNGFSVMYSELMSINAFHNRSGIVSTCQGITGSENLNLLVKKHFKKHFKE